MEGRRGVVGGLLSANVLYALNRYSLEPTPATICHVRQVVREFVDEVREIPG